MRRKKIIFAIAVVCVIFGFAFPYLCGLISIPTGLTSLSRAERQMRFLSQAVRKYRAEHDGGVPLSRSEFLRFIERQPEFAEIGKEIKDGEFQFHMPPLSNDGVLVSCYLPYPRRKTLFWIDVEGRVFHSRVWLWPVFQERDEKR